MTEPTAAEAVAGFPGPGSRGEGPMPACQVNAALSDELVMRIGIPHRGGYLASHAFQHEYPAMVSASAFWQGRAGRFVIPQHAILHELDFALDSAGFTVARAWKRSGTQPGLGGIFPWTLAQHMELAFSCGASWWAQPDMCCEPEIASSKEEIDFRVRATATFLEACMRQLYAWQADLATHLPVSTVGNLAWPCVPVIQGWEVDDYMRSLDLMMQVWQRWEPWVAPPALIGVGSVCRRSLHHPRHGLFAILRGLDGRLPRGARVHLFGVKGSGLAELKNLPWVASADSMAYDFTERVNAHRRGKPNKIEGRAQAMTRWMDKAQHVIRPHGATQRLLLL